MQFNEMVVLPIESAKTQGITDEDSQFSAGIRLYGSAGTDVFRAAHNSWSANRYRA
jgi:hypothetical protein